MSDKKVVSRSTAIGLGLVCIFLIASLVGVMLYYGMQVNTLNNDKVTLTTQYNDYVANHHHTDSEVRERAQVLDLLRSIANLSEQQIILSQYTVNQGARMNSLVETFQASYAGYVQVSITSTTTNAYITVEYSYQGHVFSFKSTLGTSGEASFCVLPSNVFIYAGNSNIIDGATHTMTVTYHY